MSTTAQSRFIPATDVAKLVRKDLRAAFAGTKFSVRTDKYSGGSTINVHWEDGPTVASVEAVVNHYCGATFDGMVDMKSYHSTLVMTENGPEEVRYGNDYLHCSRSLTAEGMSRLTQVIASDNPWRSFGEDFPTEVIDAEVDRYAPLNDRALNNCYIYRGSDLIHLYAAATDLR